MEWSVFPTGQSRTVNGDYQNGQSCLRVIPGNSENMNGLFLLAPLRLLVIFITDINDVEQSIMIHISNYGTPLHFGMNTF